MAARFYIPIEDRLLVHEGSRYTDGVHPYDPGGPTRWGITIADARRYWKPNATADDVRTMPKSVAQAIYRAKYWIANGLNLDDVAGGVDDTWFDYRVNSGEGRADKVLRRVCGLTDKVSNAVLLAELAKRDPRAIINAVNDERLRFMRSLKIWPTYKGGWTTRVAEVRAYSLQLASDTAPSLPAPKPEVQTAAKAQVTPPAGLKKAVAAGGAIATASPTTQPDWIAAHPGELALILGAGVVVTGAALWGVHAWHKLQQEAATAGLVPVPVAA